MKRTFITFILNFCFMLLYLPTFGQEQLVINLFEMEYDGETVEVTQDVDSHILGTYMQYEGKNTKIYQLGAANEESFILTEFPTILR